MLQKTAVDGDGDGLQGQEKGIRDGSEEETSLETESARYLGDEAWTYARAKTVADFLLETEFDVEMLTAQAE